MSAQWTIGNIKNPLLYFVVPWVVCFVLYGFYCWGIVALMEKVIFKDKAWEKDNPIGLFVVFFTGIVLVVLNNTDIEREKMKIRALARVVAAYSGLLDDYTAMVVGAAISGAAADAQGKGASRETITLRAQGAQALLYAPRAAAFEIASMFVVSLLLLIWENSASLARTNAEEGREIVGVFSSRQTMGFASNVTIGFNEFMEDIAAGGTWSAAMMNFARRRLGALMAYISAQPSAGGGSGAGAALTLSIQRVRDDVNAFTVMARGSVFWWINVCVRAFGVLYLFAVPFLLWMTQGTLTILWSLVVFLMVGTIVSYRIFLADVIRNPTKWDMGPVRDEIINMCRKADARINSTASANTTLTKISQKYLFLKSSNTSLID